MKHELRADLRAAYDAAVAEADPASAVRSALERRPDWPGNAERVIILALGKASRSMARAATDWLDSRDVSGTIATIAGEAAPLEGFEVVAGGHPVPDEGSRAAGEALLRRAASAKPGDAVLALISGGGSALAVAPRNGISLSEKARVTAELLRSGADITEINTVRRAMSRLKGGGLAAASAAPVLSLIISDVPGDDPSVVASGPTVPPRTTLAAADVLRKYGIRAALPPPDYTPVPEGDVEVVAGNERSVSAAANGLSDLGYAVSRLPGWVGGDVESVAREIAAAMRSAPPGSVAVLAGGEPTVVVRGSGLGGRNQDLALRVARILHEEPLDRPWSFMSAGTDGRDGPTDAAGGFADAETAARLDAAGLELEDVLACNDAHTGLKAAEDLLYTGHSGTNVADVMIAVLR